MNAFDDHLVLCDVASSGCIIGGVASFVTRLITTILVVGCLEKSHGSGFVPYNLMALSLVSEVGTIDRIGLWDFRSIFDRRGRCQGTL